MSTFIDRTVLSVLAAGVILMSLVGRETRAATVEGNKDKTYSSGLAAHYYRDPVKWGGNWPGIEPPVVSAVDWTFSTYAYTRKEPLINHMFIKRGWFSVRWQGALDTSPAGETDKTATYTFHIWADDGCRLWIDGKKLIDSWMPTPEDTPGAHRRAEIVLDPGKHAIMVEYFQGLSLEKNDRDPIRLYWECSARDIPHQILPASHFCHTDDDVIPVGGRLD